MVKTAEPKRKLTACEKHGVTVAIADLADFLSNITLAKIFEEAFLRVKS